MNKKYKKKHGIVILLDALGASEYSEHQIEKFLSARAEINDYVTALANREVKNIGKFYPPVIFTFGDTVIITIELRSKKFILDHIWEISLLLRRYLFHSMEEGILFRGSFSIGQYVEDSESNTVMGAAVTDAAAWYEQSEWMGLSCTPQTKSTLEYYLLGKNLDSSKHGYLRTYDVPMKNNDTQNLYAITWPTAFFDKDLLKRANKKTPEGYFLEILKDLSVPKGTENKYNNIKKYFNLFVQEEANKKSQSDA
ncbi:hypothetical protein HN803_07830 [candidate division WWE3 bacterium]|jgi:hypothetical protein|nr:hypothetical protein [candidate division WWE3 bacterium]